MNFSPGVPFSLTLLGKASHTLFWVPTASGLDSRHNIEYSVLCSPFYTCVPGDRDHCLNSECPWYLAQFTVTVREYSVSIHQRKELKYNEGEPLSSMVMLALALGQHFCVCLPTHSLIIVSGPLQM